MSSVQVISGGASVAPKPYIPRFPNKTYPVEEPSCSEKLWKATFGRFKCCKKNKKVERRFKKVVIVVTVMAVVAGICGPLAYFTDIKERMMKLLGN